MSRLPDPKDGLDQAGPRPEADNLAELLERDLGLGDGVALGIALADKDDLRGDNLDHLVLALALDDRALDDDRGAGRSQLLDVVDVHVHHDLNAGVA